jgi:protein tyrosine phosphatase
MFLPKQKKNSKKNNNKNNNILNKKTIKRQNGRQKGGAGAGPVVKPKEIVHFWYREWPDHGVPDIDNEPIKTRFIDFVDILIDDMNTHGGTVIHCSAGVGRTGTLFVILKLCLERKTNLSVLFAKQKDTKVDSNYKRIEENDIKNCIIYARLRRMWLVQTKIQYEFLLNLFNITIRGSYDTYWDTLGVELIPDDKNISKQLDCKNKNRYGNILPFDYNIAYIDENKKKDCSNYINASYLNRQIKSTNTYCTDDATKDFCNEITFFNGDIIATQGPLDNTVTDFLQMLDKHNIKRIIMLTRLIEGGKLKCDDYTIYNNTTLSHLTELSTKNFDGFFGNIGIYEIPSTIDINSKLIFRKIIGINERINSLKLKKELAKKKFNYIKIKDNGWCFYYAILQGLSNNPEQPATTKDAIELAKEIGLAIENKAKTDNNYKTKFFNTSEWKVKGEFTNIPDIENKIFTFDTKIEDFKKNLITKQKNPDGTNDNDTLGPLIWGDFHFFGQFVADLYNIQLNLYDFTNNELKLNTKSYNPSSGTVKKTINLFLKGDNHFDLLVPNTTQPPPDPPTDIPLTDLLRTPNFFEAQQSAGCGRHALNNLLGGQYFIKGKTPYTEYTKEEIVKVGKELSNVQGKQFELMRFCYYLKTLLIINLTGNMENYCQESENYDTNVLELALQVCGFNTENKSGSFNEEETDKTNLLGYIINYNGGHWVALQYNGTKYILINSTHNNPITYNTIKDYIKSINKSIIKRVFKVEKRKQQILPDDLTEEQKFEIGKSMDENFKNRQKGKTDFEKKKENLKNNINLSTLISGYYNNLDDTSLLLLNKIIDDLTNPDIIQKILTALDGKTYIPFLEFINIYYDIINLPPTTKPKISFCYA